MEDFKKIEAKEKRIRERLFKVEGGIAEMEVWLKDLINTGLLALQEKDAIFFEKIRARMVDAQASGLANLIRDLRELDYHTNAKWQREAWRIVTAIYLIIEGFKRWEKLDDFTRQDLKTLIGWNLNQKELLENDSLEICQDDWLLFARETELVDDITVQRNWFYACSQQRFALVLNFAFRFSPISTTYTPGTVTPLDLVYAPSATPLRALIKEQGESSESYDFQCTPITNFMKMQTQWSERLSQMPWAVDTPFLIQNLTPIVYENERYLKDSNDAILKVAAKFEEEKWWQLLAISGAKPLTVFLLWTQETLLPFGVLGKKRYVILG
jgi:hypothetical protein